MYLAWPTYLIHGTNKPAGVGLRSSHGCIRLYPEDIESIYEMVQVGEKVRSRQSAVRLRLARTLYLQTFDILEDDPRDWQKAQKKLVARGYAVIKQLAAQGDHQLGSGPGSPTIRAVPVSISRPGSSVEQVVASAPRVQNKLPSGATWDGKSNLPMDESTFRQMVSDSDPRAWRHRRRAARRPAPEQRMARGGCVPRGTRTEPPDIAARVRARASSCAA
ncbi:MAG: L,D-transpeptidase [Steroidobacteraceae bacterium]